MAQDYVEWLAVHVLNEQQLVSYRTLSRALKVHSNLAKQMLYDFHRKQNAKRPGSVHATYLITGVKHAQSAKESERAKQDGEDTVMQSSPPLPSSSMPKHDDEGNAEAIHVHTIMLVKQEHLEQAKVTFESVTGLHIYSLQANGLSDMQSLTECNRKIATEYAEEDPLQQWKQYGTIQNPQVRRRTQRRPPRPLAPTTKETVKPNEPAALIKQESKDSQEVKAPPVPTSAHATSETAKKPASKQQNSDIFKSFAKSKPKEVKSESQGSAAVSPAEDEDADMGGFSDEDDEGSDVGKNVFVEEVPKAPEGKSKKEREAELQAMMDQEDEMMQDAADALSDDDQAAENDNVIDKPPATAEEEPKETVTVENGRRRGRRRVMKKKTMKDADGYLVTREEPAWESFSEEEPAPKKIKAPPAVTTTKPATGKKAGKPGQGNIMSFFSKK